MEDNYYEELLYVLQNNKIEKLPSTKLIANNSEIALAVWSNFALEEDYYGYASFEDWYETANWKEVLSSYKEDVSFWKKAINNTKFNIDTILSNREFQNDFPKICEALSKDNEILMAAFDKTNDKSLIDLMDLSENEKDILYKKYYISEPYEIRGAVLSKYEYDDDFVKAVIKQHPQIYLSLSEQNKLNDDYINLALKEQPSLFRYVPEEKKDMIFPVWLEENYNKNLYIEQFNENQKKQIFIKRPDLLAIYLDKEFHTYKDVAVKLLQDDFEKNVGCFNIQQLTGIFREKENLEKIKPSLENFIDNYSNAKQISKKDNRIFEIISIDKNLRDKLQNNIFYQLNIMNPQQKITPEVFEGYFYSVQNKVNQENLSMDKANTFLSRMKNKLPSSVLAEQKYPEKDLYQHLENKFSKPKMKMGI